MKESKAANVVDRDQQSPSSPVPTHNPVNVSDVPYSAATDADGDAVLALYHQHFEECVRIARALGIPDPEGFVQNVFLGLMKARNRSKIDTKYVFRRVRSRIKSVYRSQCRRHERETEFALQLSVAHGEGRSGFEALQLKDDVETILSRLTAWEKQLLTAHYLDGLSIDAISRRTGQTVSAIKSILFQARKRARSQQIKLDATPARCAAVVPLKLTNS